MHSRPRTVLIGAALFAFLHAGSAASDVPAPAAKAGSSSTEARGAAYAHLMRALYVVRRGEVGAATAEIQRALERLPDSPDLLAEAAQLVLQWTARQNEAEQMLRRALALDADHPVAMERLAEMLAVRAVEQEWDEASRSEAIRLYRKLAAGDTTQRPELLERLLRLHAQDGDWDSAVQVVGRLAAERPGDPRARSTLVQLLLKTGRDREALMALIEFVVQHPHEEEMLEWAEQLANRQEAWADVVEFLDLHAPPPGAGPALDYFHGEALLHVDRVAEAATVLERAQAGRPHDVRIRWDLGLAYRGMGRLADAVAIFSELSRESPEYQYPVLQRLLAETLVEQRDLERAVRAFRNALRTLSDQEGSEQAHRDALRQRIAWVHLERDELELARGALEELEQPEDPASLEIRSQWALRASDWEEVRRLARALAERGESGIAHLLEARAALGEKKWSRAEERFQEAIRLKGPYVRPTAAELYRRSGRTEEGLTLLRHWVEADPGLADARFHLGVYWYEIERFDEAERELREAFRLDPRHARALNFLGYSLAERNMRLSEALGMIERALEVDAWNGAYLDSLGWVYYQLGRFDDARPPLERAARELPMDPTVLEHLGDVYLSLGDRAGASASWNRALAAGPENAEALRDKILKLGAVPDLSAEDSRVSAGSPQR